MPSIIIIDKTGTLNSTNVKKINEEDNCDDDSNKSYLSNTDNDILYNGKIKPIDYGKEQSYKLNRLLELYEEGNVNVEYSDILINKSTINKIDFLDTHNKCANIYECKDPKSLMKKKYKLYL